MAKWILELDYFEDQELIKIHQNALENHGKLLEIHSITRDELKFPKEQLSDHTEDLIEQIKFIAEDAIHQ